MGRIDFQVKIRGFRIDVSEIEVALRAMDGVQDAVVVGCEDSPGEKRLIAYFVPSKWPALTATQIRGSLAGTIPEYMIPSAYMCLDALPQTPNGKTDRLRLPLPSRGRPVLDVAYAAPSTLAETLLSGIWSEVLAIDQIGIHDNFFELGGDSLLASKATVRMLKELKIEIPLRMFFASPTIAQLAAEVDKGLTGTAAIGDMTISLMSVESMSEEEVREWLQRDQT